MRINARLDEEYASKLAYIQQQTNQGVPAQLSKTDFGL